VLLRRRKVLVHFHIFKNAGTSIDRVLKECFKKRWLTHDRPAPSAKLTAQEMDVFLRENPKALAVSSHQVAPPVSSEVCDVYPILLLRHPIDRAYSAYLFEWGWQDGNKTEPERPFAEYVEEKLKLRRRTAIEDYQALHLANTSYDTIEITPDTPDEVVASNAASFLEGLPCFGLVEEYGRSLAWFDRVLGGHFRNLRFRELRANSLQDASLTLDEKLARIRGKLGEAAYEELEARNTLDLALYERARSLFQG